MHYEEKPLQCMNLVYILHGSKTAGQTPYVIIEITNTIKVLT